MSTRTGGTARAALFSLGLTALAGFAATGCSGTLGSAPDDSGDGVTRGLNTDAGTPKPTASTLSGGTGGTAPVGDAGVPCPTPGSDAGTGAELFAPSPTPTASGAAAQMAPAATSGAASGPTSASLPLTLVADGGAASNVVVSLGVPFAPGVLSNEALIAVRNASNTDVARTVTVLARWPGDNSVRSALVAFRASLAASTQQAWTLSYGSAGSASSEILAANPDGPVTALLPASWYTKGGVVNASVPVASNKRFAAWDTAVEKALWSIDWTKYGPSCSGDNGSRTYYDAPHGMYQLFMRAPDAKHLRRARSEAVLYRKQELAWFSGRTFAVHVCQGTSWTPSQALTWTVLRRMYGQGMLDDYLLTGDPAAREAVVAMGEAFRQNLPTLTSGSAPSIEATERNLAWVLMGVVSAYAVDPRAELKTALTALVDRTAAWQGRGASGGFEHDIVRPDPDECSTGPAGASPFMTSLLADGLMDAYRLTKDTRVPEMMRKLASWYETKAITSDKQAFRYLWNCQSNAYDDSSTADLNLLIAHVLGAAAVLNKDTHFLTLGDSLAGYGIDAAAASVNPKHWSQASRSFATYLGYRTQAGLTP